MLTREQLFDLFERFTILTTQSGTLILFQFISVSNVVFPNLFDFVAKWLCACVLFEDVKKRIRDAVLDKQVIFFWAFVLGFFVVPSSSMSIDLMGPLFGFTLYFSS